MGTHEYRLHFTELRPNRTTSIKRVGVDLEFTSLESLSQSCPNWLHFGKRIVANSDPIFTTYMTPPQKIKFIYIYNKKEGQI
jgi:hypothetical protein